MSLKKRDARFTIQFSRDKPAHMKVADILNHQDSRGKARYIVDAVLHYESCGKRFGTKRAEADENSIEIAVKRILDVLKRSGTFKQDMDTLMHDDLALQSVEITHDDVNFDSAIDGLCKDRLEAITNALDMFRRK